MPKVTKSNLTSAKKKPTVVKEKKSEVTCCICISDIDEKTAASIDCCTHKYCKDCIETWAKTENSCPQCKKKFTKITALKKGCKRKTTSVEVEDKRQRPDNPRPMVGTRNRIEETIDMIQVAQALGVMTSAQVNHQFRVVINSVCAYFNTRETLPDEYFTDGFQPWDLPIDIIYHVDVRAFVLIFFANSETFRAELLLVLSAHHGILPVQPAAGKILRSHMFFNIINRFFSSTIPLVQNDLTMWVRVARDILFNGGNITFDNGRPNITTGSNVIDVDADVPARPDHPQLIDTRRCFCIQRQVIELYHMLKDTSPTQALGRRRVTHLMTTEHMEELFPLI